MTLDALIAGLQKIADAHDGPVAVQNGSRLFLYSPDVFPPAVEGLPVDFYATAQCWCVEVGRDVEVDQARQEEDRQLLAWYDEENQKRIEREAKG